MNNENNEESSIERLKRSLYSRNEQLVPKEKRTSLRGGEFDVSENWGTENSLTLSEEELVKKNMMSKNKKSFFDKFLIASIIFFVIAAAITTFVFLGGMNMISSSNVDIKVTAPSSISSGEEVDMDVSVLNQNRTDLENVNLIIDYPSGAKSIADGSALSRQKISIGKIVQNEKSSQSIRMLILGQKDATKTVNLTLEYSIKGSLATFSKHKSFDLKIGSSPLLLNISSPKEINSGQTVSLDITVTSNSSVPLKNVLIKVEYPYGFTFKDSSIPQIGGTSGLWNVGDLQNGGKKTLSISGELVGQNEEDRTFRVSSGTADQDTTDKLSTYLASNDVTVGLRKSFYNLDISEGDGIVRPGEAAMVSVSWQNTLTNKIVNNKISATLSGNAFDKSAVSPSSGGFYRSSDTTVLWDKNGFDSLSEISPLQNGQVGFTVTPLSQLILQNVKNPHIDIHVVMTGNKTGSDSSQISSDKSFTLKVPTTLNFIGEVHRTSGPFTNTGPIPPKVDLETTYTVTWTLTNTVNDLSQTSVTTKLPAGVNWKNLVSPGSEKVSYNPDSRTVTWNVGNVSYGAGFTTSPRSVSFELGIIPSANQARTELSLTSNINVSGTDSYTSMPISTQISPLSTRFVDPSFKDGDSTVVP